MAENHTWQYLIEQYLSNSLSKEELKELLQKAASEEDMETLTLLLKQQWEKEGHDVQATAEWDEKFSRMLEEARQATPVILMQKSKKKKWIYRVAAAAVLVISLSISYFLFTQKNEDTIAVTQTTGQQKKDLTPGRNTAVLTLGDGSAIVLDDAQNGALANQGNTTIIKLDDGQLAYNASKEITGEVLYNTMTTPRGGQYKLVLPDGSSVWLNAASSIRYPTSFPGKERKVEITGEVYFEVAKNAAKPFKVLVNDMEVAVLGTHFNINAYSDEAATQTTLLEGSVSISKGDNKKLLKPGQQAQLNKPGDIKIINDVNIASVMAWKNGYFSFDNTDMAAVMRQISRWYDVDIVYEGKIPDRKFGGEISRSSNALQVLRILEESKVRFRIEGRKIIVQP